MNSRPKPQRWQSKPYRRYVAGHPCLRCGIDGFSQCCHPNGAGMGTKADDRMGFPLCCTRPGIPGCHYEHDQCIGMTLEERKEREAEYAERMQAKARADGRQEFA